MRKDESRMSVRSKNSNSNLNNNQIRAGQTEEQLK
jgi:hypothetical protein